MNNPNASEATLLDMFACSVMEGMITCTGEPAFKEPIDRIKLAHFSYAIAKEMLAERERVMKSL